MNCTCPNCGHTHEVPIGVQQTADDKALVYGFDDFWHQWPAGPRKGGKAACLAIWKRKKLAAQHSLIMSHIAREKSGESWQSGFVPMPRTYLNQMRWDGADEAPTEGGYR